MSSDTRDTNLSKDIQKHLSNLQALRDETRLKLHLAGMDVKSSWEQLAPMLLEAEKAAAATATETTRTLLTETIKKLIALKARIPDAGSAR